MDRVVSCVICMSVVNAFAIGSTRTGVIWREKGDPSKAFISKPTFFLNLLELLKGLGCLEVSGSV